MREFWARLAHRFAIHTAITARRTMAYTTVLTTCTRLFEKGLLRRALAERSCSYVYTPTIDEHSFVSRALAGILDSLGRNYPNPGSRVGHAPRPRDR